MQFTDLTFSQWSTIASIFSPVIAILIAICSSRQTSKQTQKQIDSIKDLARLQIEASLIPLEIELFNTEFDEYDAKGELLRIHNKLETLRQNPNENKEQLEELKSEFEKLATDMQSFQNWKIQLINMEFRLERAKISLNQKQ